jgi:hypothetical protein
MRWEFVLTRTLSLQKTYKNSIKFKNKLGIFLKEKVSKNDFIAGKKILSLKIF